MSCSCTSAFSGSLALPDPTLCTPNKEQSLKILHLKSAVKFEMRKDFISLTPAVVSVEIIWWSGRGRILSDEEFGVKPCWWCQSRVRRGGRLILPAHTTHCSSDRTSRAAAPESLGRVHSCRRYWGVIISSADEKRAFLGPVFAECSGWKGTTAGCAGRSKPEHTAPEPQLSLRDWNKALISSWTSTGTEIRSEGKNPNLTTLYILLSLIQALNQARLHTQTVCAA